MEYRRIRLQELPNLNCQDPRLNIPDPNFIPMPSLYETLRADIIAAMKARDTATATMLRTADAAIQRAAMDTGKPIDEALALTSLKKSVEKPRRRPHRV